MLPTLGNPAGLWALAAVPVLLAIHCLQQRTQRLVVSTWFLLEPLAPESRGGRRLHRLRGSRTLWLQLVAALLATWVLVEPRWPRAQAMQTVAVVIDSAAAMSAFRTETERAVAERFASADVAGVNTTWLLLTSDPRATPLYRGADRDAALEALRLWLPRLGTHDPAPALQRARTLAGPEGIVWFVTYARDRVPPGQTAVGVGSPLANAGFAGATVERAAGGLRWRALVRNHSAEAQTRAWTLRVEGQVSPEQTVTLPADGLVELSGAWPEGAERAVLALAADDFTLDDVLPMQRPQPKPLAVNVSADGEVADYFRRVLEVLPGARRATDEGAGLLVMRTQAAVDVPSDRAAVVLPAPPAEGAKSTWQPAAVTATAHPLVEGLAWSGWLGTGAGEWSPAAGDEPLLWQDGRALAWLRRMPAGTEQLWLNFSWEAGNAGRLPAMVLLVRRFAERVRAARSEPWAENFDAGSLLPLAAELYSTDPSWRFTWEPASRLSQTDGHTEMVSPHARNVLRAPLEPAFFEVRDGERVLLSGAAQWADARQGDLRDAASFEQGVSANATAERRERLTRADPLMPLWLVVAGVVLVASWWPARKALA